MISLDVDAVRAFVMIADLQSFTRAAEALGTTQGAISVKLKRLEERLQQRLIERTPRLVRLSSQGQLLIEPARQFLGAHDRAVSALQSQPRRFKLGIAGHVMGPEVPTLLAKLKLLHPELAIEVLIDNSQTLLEEHESGNLDAVIVRSDDDKRGGEVLGPEPFGWFTASGFEHRQGDPLPLASHPDCCSVREVAKRLLDDAAIPWNEVFVGDTAAVSAALSAGFAVAAFPCRLTTTGMIEISEVLGLPAIPSLSLVLHSSLSDQRTKAILRTITAAFRQHRRASQSQIC